MEALKLVFFFIILYFSILNYILSKNFWSLTYVKTFVFFYFLFLFIFLLSSILSFLKRNKASGFLNLSFFFFFSFLFLSISFYKKTNLSIGRGEELYNLEKSEGGFLSKAINYNLYLKDIDERIAKIIFDEREFNLKEKVYFKNKKVKLIGIWKSIEINVFQEGGYNEAVFFKLTDNENSYFPLSTLPYRIYIKKIDNLYEVKIYKNKKFVLKKEVKLNEILPFDFLNIKLKEGPLWCLIEIEDFFSFYYYIIPLIFFIFSFYDKLKK